ncbi:hypothetical protein IMZ11_41230 [Microtetraspora sp. AC03309]|uniref:hypothetical protein n=1 Tax=Microtetraspora sp. AC03309 TaxID=2779376 RepID=UPI001E580FFE|nr:hypothetical protein [Microtetraspora sp. AC03309]MCC5582041.1 hypothetical protein [Microtetraspora sp. AC03309]
MGIHLIVEVMDYAPATLTHSEHKTLMVFAESARDETRQAWPGIEDDETFARRTRLGRSQRYAVVKALVAKGALVRVSKGHNASRAVYMIPPLAAVVAAVQGPENPDASGLQRPENPDPGSNTKGPGNPDQASGKSDGRVRKTRTPSPQSPHDPSSLGAAGRVMEATGASEEEARRIVDLIKAEKAPRSLNGYVSTLAANGDLADWLHRVRAADEEHELRAWLEKVRAMGECEHGTPGGVELHPVSGEPHCPLCRSEARAHPAA